MAAWTKDLKAFGGFDERYQGWGCEDNRLAVRLINAGFTEGKGITRPMFCISGTKRPTEAARTITDASCKRWLMQARPAP